jgi:acyl carrier protein
MKYQEAVDGVKEVIVSLFDLGVSAGQIRDDEAVFETGIGLDSMAAVELLEGLEARFGIVLGNEDLDMANFSTVEAVARLVCRKAGDGQAFASGGWQGDGGAGDEPLR